MSRAKLPYLKTYRDRWGKERNYLRQPGFKEIPLKSPGGTLAFAEEYVAALEINRLKGPSRGRSAKPGTLGAAVTNFYESAEFTQAGNDDQRRKRACLDELRNKYGNLPIGQLRWRHIRKMRDEKAATPTAANRIVNYLRQVLQLAVEDELIPFHPIPPFGAYLEIKSKGWHTWSEAEIEAFRRRWPLGTKERLGLELYLNTAQRGIDTRLVGPSHIKGDDIEVLSSKNGVPVTVPIMPELREALAATPTGEPAFVLTRSGRPYSAGGWCGWFSAAAREAGMEKFQAGHGLRKAASRRMAEAGATDHEIISVTGHVNTQHVQRYTREANRTKMAKSAIDKVNASLERRCLTQEG